MRDVVGQLAIIICSQVHQINLERLRHPDRDLFSFLFGGHDLGGLLVLAARAPQVRPIDVGAKVLACHLPIRSALDDRAPLRWHTAIARRPLIDGSVRHSKYSSELALPADQIRCVLDWIHGVQRIALLTARQAMHDDFPFSVAI